MVPMANGPSTEQLLSSAPEESLPRFEGEGLGIIFNYLGIIFSYLGIIFNYLRFKTWW